VFADGRGTDKIAGQLTGFSGILQVDGWRRDLGENGRCEPQAQVTQSR
jgi:hypothetical protein